MEAAELMGHADISAAHKIYTHLKPSKRDGVSDKLNGYFAALIVNTSVSIDNA